MGVAGALHDQVAPLAEGGRAREGAGMLDGVERLPTLGMPSEEDRPQPGPGEHLGAEQAEPTVPQDGAAREAREVELLRDLEGRGEGLGEDRRVVRHRVGHRVQVALRQHQPLGEGAGAAEDAEHRALRAVAREASPTGRTDLAADVDLADHPPPGERARLGDPDELVAGDAAKAHVPAREREVGGANSGAQNAHGDLVAGASPRGTGPYGSGRARTREVRAQRDPAGLDPQTSHGSARVPAGGTKAVSWWPPASAPTAPRASAPRTAAWRPCGAPGAPDARRASRRPGAGSPRACSC